MPIGRERVFESGERGNQRKQTRLRKMEIRQQLIGDAKGLAGE
jgi:hypothetical protein